MLGMEQIATVLAQASLGQIGKSIFVHRMPGEISSGLVVLNQLSGYSIDWELPGFKIGKFQVIARHTSVPQGLSLARGAMAALTWQEPRMLPAQAGLNDILVRRVLPMHDPITYPRSDGDMVEHSINFEFVAVET